MNRRNLDILDLIIKNSNIKSSEIEQHLNITRRQLSYALNQINQDLQDKGSAPIKRLKTGKFIAPKELSLLFPSLNTTTKKVTSIATFHEEKQRQQMLILYTLTSSEFLSLVHFCEFLNVSKTTATSDVQGLKKMLPNYKLALTYSRKDGYMITGNELDIQIAINEIVSEFLNFEDGAQIILDLSDNGIEPIVHFAHEVEKDLGVSYSDSAFNNTIYTLLLMIKRRKKFSQEGENYFHNRVTDTEEFLAVKKSVLGSWHLTADDIEWTTVLFLSANAIKGTFNTAQVDLRNAVAEMTTQFENMTLVEIKDKSEFQKRLTIHLRPAVYRVKYNLHLRDMGVQKIVKNDVNHQILIGTVKQIIKPLEKLVGRKFPNEEIELISYYFGSVLENRQDNSLTRKRAAVVCNNGVIVAKLMFSSLRKLFPEVSFLNATSVREFENFSEDYDLVFTTVPLRTKARQYIVHPVLNQEEKLSLRYRVLRDIGSENNNDMIAKIMNIFSPYVDDINQEKIRAQISQILNNVQPQSLDADSGLPNLLEYLSPENIQIVDSVKNWQDGLTKAIAPLRATGIVDEKYVQSLAEQVASANNYSFLGQKMAIPHTTADNGVFGDAFGFLVIRDPVSFPGEHSIQIIVPLAIQNTTKHLQAIQQLEMLATNHEVVQEILTAPNNTNIYEIIKKFLKENRK